MLSYRHSFHAGNHADVLKHQVLMMVLKSVIQKDKPAIYIDTHSGAGLYDLGSEEAQKNAEYLSGINKFSLYQGTQELIQAYQSVLSEYFAQHLYPGSPVIAASILRQQDKLALMELHNNEVTNLRQTMKTIDTTSEIGVHHRDGFEGLLALLPPKPARGVVLIDPPYERAEEYECVTQAIQKGLKKWASGIFLIWYPLLSARAAKKSGKSEHMVERISHLPVKNALNVTLQVEPNTPESGMYGSGMLIINAPWKLDQQLGEVLPELSELLTTQRDNYSLEWLVKGD